MDDYFFVNPKRNNDRIKAQNGAFIIVGGIKIEEEKTTNNSNDKNDLKNKLIEKTDSPSFPKEKTKFYIDCGKKKDILKELDVLGINKGNLYCDLSFRVKEISKTLK